MFRIPSPATCISTVALLFAVTGTAAASGLITGARIKDNTVGSPDIRNNSIATQDVKNNSMTSLDVLDGSLKASDFAPGELSTGPAGPAGPAGAPAHPARPAQPARRAPRASRVSRSSTLQSATIRRAEGRSSVDLPGRQEAGSVVAPRLGAAGLVAVDESYPAHRDPVARNRRRRSNPTARQLVRHRLRDVRNGCIARERGSQRRGQ